MRALMLPYLALALPRLLDDEDEVLGRTLCGQLYRPRLLAQLEAIDALPPAGPTGRPLAEALAAAELLADTIALLADLRSAAAEELAAEPELLDRVDADLGAFIDALAFERDPGPLRPSRVTTEVRPASIVSGAPALE